MVAAVESPWSSRLEDVSSHDFDPAQYHTTREELLGVIHGVFPDGQMVAANAALIWAARIRC
jgi:hypothetical protein